MFGKGGGEFEGAGGAAVEHQVQELGARIVADRVHHSLALEDQAHVEVGQENALALGKGRHDMPALGRDDCRHAAAGEAALQAEEVEAIGEIGAGHRVLDLDLTRLEDEPLDVLAAR